MHVVEVRRDGADVAGAMGRMRAWLAPRIHDGDGFGVAEVA
jgi:hypothetical protein